MPLRGVGEGQILRVWILNQRNSIVPRRPGLQSVPDSEGYDELAFRAFSSVAFNSSTPTFQFFRLSRSIPAASESCDPLSGTLSFIYCSFVTTHSHPGTPIIEGLYCYPSVGNEFAHVHAVRNEFSIRKATCASTSSAAAATASVCFLPWQASPMIRSTERGERQAGPPSSVIFDHIRFYLFIYVHSVVIATCTARSPDWRSKSRKTPRQGYWAKFQLIGAARKCCSPSDKSARLRNQSFQPLHNEISIALFLHQIEPSVEQCSKRTYDGTALRTARALGLAFEEMLQVWGQTHPIITFMLRNLSPLIVNRVTIIFLGFPHAIQSGNS